MKKGIKIALRLLAVAILLAGCFAAYIYFKGIPKYPVAIPADIAAMKVVGDSIRIERGKKIASLLCRECHLDPSTGHLTGSFRADVPAEFGKIFSKNITQQPEKGIGNWSDGQLYFYLRTGQHPLTGLYVPPYMPKYPLMADEDLKSVIAWLRSDDPVCQPAPQEFPENRPNFLVKFLSNVAFKPLPLPAAPISVPDTANRVAFGKYVANGLVNCYACHSADFKKTDDLHPEKSAGFYGGGNPLLDAEGKITIPSANITMDEETGIGKWTETQFLEAVKYAKNPRGGLLRYPMAPHAALSDSEVKAIFAYLKTVPVIKNPVPKN